MAAADAAGAAGQAWAPPGGGAVRAVEMHSGGEPLRVVVPGGLGPLAALAVPGLTLLERRRLLLSSEGLVRARRRLMLEPRGHRDMYGALLVPSEVPGAALGALFVHGEGASAMCGHAVLCLARLALDYGLCPPPPQPGPAPVLLHCPCGPVLAHAAWDGRRSRSRVRFHSVPAFAAATASSMPPSGSPSSPPTMSTADVLIEVPGYGMLVVDIGYGGTFYAFLSAEQLGLDLSSSRLQALVDAASAVTEAVKTQFKVSHPIIEDVAFIYGTILTDGKDAFSDEPTSNICVFADAQVDRSPTGSGVTARIALQYHKGLIQLNQTRTFRSSTTGSSFTGKAVKETKCGDHSAVIVEVSGESFYTGTSTFTFEEEDPLKHGFLLK